MVDGVRWCLQSEARIGGYNSKPWKEEGPAVQGKWETQARVEGCGITEEKELEPKQRWRQKLDWRWLCSIKWCRNHAKIGFGSCQCALCSSKWSATKQLQLFFQKIKSRANAGSTRQLASATATKISILDGIAPAEHPIWPHSEFWLKLSSHRELPTITKPQPESKPLHRAQPAPRPTTSTSSAPPRNPPASNRFPENNANLLQPRLSPKEDINGSQIQKFSADTTSKQGKSQPANNKVIIKLLELEDQWKISEYK